MKYDVTRFSVHPGQQVKVTLTNVGKVPKAGMAHNFVLLDPSADPKEFATAAASAGENHYIPVRFENQILARTNGHAGPGETVTAEFTAPTKRGEYVYLCTFPGHYFAGMTGTMVVK